MTIYIDENFYCYTSKKDNLIAIETDFFDNKCQTFIEGYRFIPENETWIREDGTVFTGEMAFPWKPYPELSKAQQQYEKELLSETQKVLSILFGEAEV